MDLQGQVTGQQGRAGGFADPDDVEVHLPGQDSAWGEENDILTYVQSKVSLSINLAHLDTCCAVKLNTLMLYTCLHWIAVTCCKFAVKFLVQQC